MLDVEAIIDDNIEDYFSLLGKDVSEDMNREFYRAYGALEGDAPVGVIVYEICNADKEDEDVKSKIRLLKSDKDDALDLLHQTYKEEGAFGEDVKETSYWLEDEKLAASCEKAGFSKEFKENDTITITLGDAAGIDFVTKMKKVPDYIRSLEDISSEQYRMAIKDSLFSGRKGLVEDLGYLKKEWFENTVSACVITDDKVSGLFLIRITPSGIIEPVLLEASGPDSSKHMAFMIAFSIKKGMEKYPLASTIRIGRERKEIFALVDKLFPGVKGSDAFYGSRKEE